MQLMEPKASTHFHVTTVKSQAPGEIETLENEVLRKEEFLRKYRFVL